MNEISHRIVIGGDVSPIRRAMPMFHHGDARKIFTDALSVFDQADMSIINLECSFISQHDVPITKDGPNLGVPDRCVAGIKNAGIAGVNMANNHSFDYGNSGLIRTIEACRRAGIFHFGAGDTLKEAGKIIIHPLNGIRFGFLGMAEHEFSIAGKYSAGANPLDLIRYVRTVALQKNDYDFLIVLIHGGKEYYPYPTPRLMDICHFLVEQGAGTVICQHSHCPGCYEIYRGAPIVYGQGNLIFDRPDAPSSWHEGFLVQLNVNHDLSCSLELFPYLQFYKEPCVALMQGKKKHDFLNILAWRSEQILDENFVEREWEDYCKQQKYTYFSRLYGYNRFLRILNRKIHFSDWLCSRTKKLMVRNVVECETHREVLETLWRRK